MIKKPRTFKQLQADPRVCDWSDERSQGLYNEGIWIYLAPGWVTCFEGLTTIHEDTVAICCEEVRLAQYSPETWTGAMQYMDHQKPALLPAG